MPMPVSASPPAMHEHQLIWGAPMSCSKQLAMKRMGRTHPAQDGKTTQRHGAQLHYHLAYWSLF